MFELGDVIIDDIAGLVCVVGSQPTHMTGHKGPDYVWGDWFSPTDRSWFYAWSHVGRCKLHPYPDPIRAQHAAAVLCGEVRRA